MFTCISGFELGMLEAETEDELVAMMVEDGLLKPSGDLIVSTDKLVRISRGELIQIDVVLGEDGSVVAYEFVSPEHHH